METYWCHYITLSVQVQSSAGVWASLHPTVTCHTAYYPRRGELSENKKQNNMTIADLLWNEPSPYVEIKPF